MNFSIGIDTVEIQRFAHFNTYTHKQLRRIFSDNEIYYALQTPSKTAERFAVRFAAKEAFLKALFQLHPHDALSLLTITQQVSIEKVKKGVPFLYINWKKLQILYPNTTRFNSTISLTHSNATATAVVILYNKI